MTKYVLLVTVGDTLNRFGHSSLRGAKSAKATFMKAWYDSYVPHSCVITKINDERDMEFLARMRKENS